MAKSIVNYSKDIKRIIDVSWVLWITKLDNIKLTTFLKPPHPPKKKKKNLKEL